MTFAVFEPPAGGAPGFAVVAGRPSGLQRIMLVAGRLPAGDQGPTHAHDGDEILRVVTGEIVVTLGAETRTCGPGDVVAIPPRVLHGFRVTTDTVLEVVAEYDIGTLHPIGDQTGTPELVEVHRRDLPWGRTPAPGHSWTTDEELAAILARSLPAVPSASNTPYSKPFPAG